MYHRVSNQNIRNIKDSLPFLFISESNFEKQLAFIKKRFHVIGFEELELYKKAGKLPRNSLIITFDDGYQDNYSPGYQLLKKYALKACFFIAPGLIGMKERKFYWWDRAYSLFQRRSETSLEEKDPGRDPLFQMYRKLGNQCFAELNTWDTRKIEENLDAVEGKQEIPIEVVNSENSLLNWGQVLEMSREMEFGSHTCNHLNLCTLSMKEMELEIRESRIMIEEKTGKRVLAFSYPAGNFREETLRVVEKAGYKFAVSTHRGVNSLKGMLRLKRINIWEETALGLTGGFSKGYFAFKILGC